METTQQVDREVVRCGNCRLVQYRTRSGNCRRCLRNPLPPKPALTNPTPASVPAKETDESGTGLDAGFYLNEILTGLNIRQRNFARKSELSRSHVSKIVNSKNDPSPTTLGRIIRATEELLSVATPAVKAKVQPFLYALKVIAALREKEFAARRLTAPAAPA